MHSRQDEVVFLAGPFHVPAMSHDEHMKMEMDMAMNGEHEAHAYSPLIRFEWPVDGWYRGFRCAVVGADGCVLPRSLMHHVTGVDFDRRQLLNGEAERFLAAGSETADPAGGHLLAMPTRKFLPFGLRVAGGHRYRVVGEYESPRGTTRPQGGMALMVGLFVPSDTGQWPAVDRNDPQMIVDLETLPGGSRATAPVIGTMQRSDP